MSKPANRRRKWGIDLTVGPMNGDASAPPSHPMHNVSQAGRDDSRVQTLAKVLANIARRAEARRVANGEEGVK